MIIYLQADRRFRFIFAFGSRFLKPILDPTNRKVSKFMANP